MKIEEAIKNLEKGMKCRKEECLGQCREGEDGCPYFVNYDAYMESLQVVIEYFKIKINPSNNPCAGCLESMTHCRTCSFF